LLGIAIADLIHADLMSADIINFNGVLLNVLTTAGRSPGYLILLLRVG